jgi:hypothetical protein
MVNFIFTFLNFHFGVNFNEEDKAQECLDWGLTPIFETDLGCALGCGCSSCWPTQTCSRLIPNPS